MNSVTSTGSAAHCHSVFFDKVGMDNALAFTRIGDEPILDQKSGMPADGKPSLVPVSRQLILISWPNASQGPEFEFITRGSFKYLLIEGIFLLWNTFKHAECLGPADTRGTKADFANPALLYEPMQTQSGWRQWNPSCPKFCPLSEMPFSCVSMHNISSLEAWRHQ